MRKSNVYFRKVVADRGRSDRAGLVASTNKIREQDSIPHAPGSICTLRRRREGAWQSLYRLLGILSGVLLFMIDGQFFEGWVMRRDKIEKWPVGLRGEWGWWKSKNQDSYRTISN